MDGGGRTPPCGILPPCAALLRLGLEQPQRLLLRLLRLRLGGRLRTLRPALGRTLAPRPLFGRGSGPLVGGVLRRASSHLALALSITAGTSCVSPDSSRSSKDLDVRVRRGLLHPDDGPVCP